MGTKTLLIKFGTIIWGIAFGLFIGILIFGTILRIIFNLLFHWGDAGPDWVVWLIAIITIISIILSCKMFLKWTDAYLRRKKLLGD